MRRLYACLTSVFAIATLTACCCPLTFRGQNAAVPMPQPNPPIVNAPIRAANGAQAQGANGLPLWLEPVTAAAPRAWPPAWAAPSNPLSLLLAVGCYWLWCFALAPRIWRGRRGPLFALRLNAARVRRELMRPPLRWLLTSRPCALPGPILWWLCDTSE